jgi:hypothetical protein
MSCWASTRRGPMTGREPNHRLAAVMQRAGCSNKGLARRVQRIAVQHGVEVRSDHVSVKRWLDGIRPRGLTPHFIAEALSGKLGEPVSVRDIGMTYAQVSDVSTAVDLPQSEADCATSGVAGLVAGDLSANPLVAQSDISTDSWNDSMVTWLVSPGPVSPSSPQIDGLTPGSIEAVRATTDMFSRLDYRFGGGHARSALIQYLAAEVEPLLEATTPDTALGREFLGEVAALMRLAAWMAYDTGRHGLAQRYMTKALALSKAAGNRMLGGRILAGMSHQANYLGHYATAANLARAARMGADGSATPTAMALFYAMEARALASQDDEPGCSRALSHAEEWFERRNAEDDPDWLRYFDTAELAAEFAHCFRDLNHPARARDYVLQSIAESESLYVRSLSFVRTILATSYVREGELEQAVSVAREVVTTVADLRSTRTRRYVQEFLDGLTSYEGDLAVSEFRAFAGARLADARRAASEWPPAPSRRAIAERG